ncbi:MAG: DNA-binding protein [Candidatus Saccharibacteria bacterium]|nr:DNA-binding protein [Candidatus Saccharibacteria bacterium]
MKIGILGSGAVGVALAKGFMAEGHEVHIATREPDGEKGTTLKNELDGATVTDFAAAAAAGELLVLCVKAAGVEATIQALDAAALAGKVLIDTTNVMQQENGLMIYAGDSTSVAEKLQALLPDTHVVKAFNTVGAAIMYKPDLGETPTMFVAGNDESAKQQVAEIMGTFGWETLDTGPVVAARALEHLVTIWVNNAMANGAHHALKML